MQLPLPLAEPTRIDGKPAFKVLLELVFYHDALTIGEFDALLDLWREVCPRERLTLFTISELDFWSRLDTPVLTESARAAAEARLSWPMFEATRRRIQMGRALKAQIWDGLRIDQAPGTWSMEVRRIHRRDSGLHGYVRMLFPIDTATDLLIDLACRLGDLLPAHSGHGGLVFTYEPDLRFEAFRYIYAAARRFHGVDVEALKTTLTLMRTGLKSPCWLNFLGAEPAREDVFSKVRGQEAVRVFDLAHGTLCALGDAPAILDVNRPPVPVQPYQALAESLAGRMISDIGEFNGGGWLEDMGSADAWLTRFHPASSWRPGEQN